MIEGLSELLGVYHPFHATAREELADLVVSRFVAPSQPTSSEAGERSSSPFLAFTSAAEAAPDEAPTQHILLHGPTGSGKRNLAKALQACLKGRIDVAIVENDVAPKIDHGIVVWIARDGVIPKFLPPRTPRVRVRSLASSEKRRLMGVLIESICPSYEVNPSEFLQDEIFQAVLRGGFAEAGILGATQRLHKLCRRRARARLENSPVLVDLAWARSVLGPEAQPQDLLPKRLTPGSVLAPVVSSLGGAVALIEVFAIPGKGRLTLTGAGNHAEVAAQVARSRCLALAEQLGLMVDSLREMDWHIHVTGPDGPKDGTSLGWPVVVAMVSHLMGVPVEARYAFTGEIGLSGEVRPVGGVEEKFLACEREGLKRLWMPGRNLLDLSPLDQSALGSCTPTPVTTDIVALRQMSLISKT